MSVENSVDDPSDAPVTRNSKFVYLTADIGGTAETSKTARKSHFLLLEKLKHEIARKQAADSNNPFLIRLWQLAQSMIGQVIVESEQLTIGEFVFVVEDIISEWLFEYKKMRATKWCDIPSLEEAPAASQKRVREEPEWSPYSSGGGGDSNSQYAAGGGVLVKSHPTPQ